MHKFDFAGDLRIIGTLLVGYFSYINVYIERIKRKIVFLVHSSVS